MISVEVVFATDERQRLIELLVRDHSTLLDVIAQSDIQSDFPDVDLSVLPKGVWGEVKPDNHIVSPGDRIEIYRPLVTDPKEARRKRAEKRRP